MSDKKPVFIAFDDGTMQAQLAPRQLLGVLRAICDDLHAEMVIASVAERKLRPDGSG